MKIALGSFCLTLISIGIPSAKIEARPVELGHARGDESDGGWVRIFNEKNLDGWVVKINHQNIGQDNIDIFSVKNGEIRVSYDKMAAPFNSEYGHLFYKIPYTSFRLKMDYQFDGPDTAGAPPWTLSNSGVMIFSQSPETIGHDQPFPISIEIQLLGARAGEVRRTASLCTPGTRAVIYGRLTTDHCVNSLGSARPNGAWVHLEIEVRADGRISHYIDGEQVMQYEQPQLDNTDLRVMEYRSDQLISGPGLLTKGFIALQAESAPIKFRNIYIKPMEN